MDDDGKSVAARLVAQKFVDARAVWLGGSVAAGTQTSASDLDITVLLDGPPAAPSFPDGLGVRPMTVRDAESVATWRYSGPCAVYDMESAQPILDDLPGYFAVASGDRLVGFCCVGHAARIPGLTERMDVLDVGLGMDPELVGGGCGEEFGRTVLAFLATTHPDQELRAVVQDWNERSLRLTRRLGFEDAGELTAVQGGHRLAYRIVEHRTRERN